jgi:hypothetical protein
MDAPPRRREHEAQGVELIADGLRGESRLPLRRDVAVQVFGPDSV